MFRRKTSSIDYAEIHARYEDTALVIFKRQKREAKRSSKSLSVKSHNRVDPCSGGPSPIAVERNDVAAGPKISDFNSNTEVSDDNRPTSLNADKNEVIRRAGVQSKVCVVL